MFRPAALVCLSLYILKGQAQTYTATYLPSNAPVHSEDGQAGTNKCGAGFNQSSICQNAYLNSVDDFCLFAPPNPGPSSTIGDTERIEVSWCLQANYGTRVIPDGAITGAHFVQTPDYVQITGYGDLTKINIAKGDAGGELDPHGADGNGNPIGGLVFSNAFGGNLQQLHEWTNFMSATQFCFRGCKDGKNARKLCQHIYDVLGCDWNMPGNYAVGSFDNCKGDSGEPMGIYGSSTFHQGDPVTPPPHPAPPVSSCTPLTTVGNNLAITSGAAGFPSSSMPTSATATGASTARTGTPTGSGQTAHSGAGTTMANLSLLVVAVIAASMLQ